MPMSMEQKRPQLNLAELYQLKWLLGSALAVLSAWTVLYMDVEAWLWLVLITACVPVVVVWPVLTLHVPRWIHRLAFPLFVALFVTDYYLNREVLPAMIRLALMLVFYRAMTPRKRRDDLQLIVLGLFLVVIAGVLSVSLAFAVQIVVFTGCTLMFLLVITLIDTAETGQAQAEVSRSSPPVWMRIEWLRLGRRLHAAIDWRVAVLGGVLFGGVVGLSALLFFALPRFELNHSFFLDSMITGQSKTGFSETVSFDDVTDIQQDTSVAVRVDVSDRGAIPANPYWRMLILDNYRNGVFSASKELQDQLRTQRDKLARVAGGVRPRAGTAVWVFYMEGGTSRYLPTLGGFYSMQFNDGPQAYAINDELRLLRLENPPAKMFAYRVEGMKNEAELGPVEIKQRRDFPGLVDLENVPAPMPTFLKIELDEPDVAKVRGWVEALHAPDGDVRAFAWLASAWLEKNHAYSLQMNQGPGDGDPLVRWMGSSHPGHCELFAGGFTLLARVAGYPARMVTGFRGGSWNPGSNHLSIRNSDAHAWCEIYDQASEAWVRVDPTPGGAIPRQAPATESSDVVLERMRDTRWTAKLDGLRMFWYRRIVDFDQNTQEELARDAKKAIEHHVGSLKEMINRRLEAISAWLREPWDVARLTAWILIVATAFGVVLGWRGYGRGAWMRLRSGLTRRGVDPVRREAGRWLRKMEEHATHVGDKDEWTRVRAELERLRYGPRKGWGNPQGTFRRAKRACRMAKR